jgi:hypothetical protein
MLSSCIVVVVLRQLHALLAQLHVQRIVPDGRSTIHIKAIDLASCVKCCWIMPALAIDVQLVLRGRQYVVECHYCYRMHAVTSANC